MVMIEALACGTPVLTFAEGAAPEIVADGVTGYICEDDDAMGSRCAEVDQLDRNACRAAVESYFCADRMVREHLELFEEILKA